MQIHLLSEQRNESGKQLSLERENYIKEQQKKSERFNRFYEKIIEILLKSTASEDIVERVQLILSGNREVEENTQRKRECEDELADLEADQRSLLRSALNY